VLITCCGLAALDPTYAVPIQYRERLLRQGSAIPSSRSHVCESHNRSGLNARLANTLRGRCFAESMLAVGCRTRRCVKEICAIMQALRQMADCRAVADGLGLQFGIEKPHERFGKKLRRAVHRHAIWLPTGKHRCDRIGGKICRNCPTNLGSLTQRAITKRTRAITAESRNCAWRPSAIR